MELLQCPETDETTKQTSEPVMVDLTSLSRSPAENAWKSPVIPFFGDGK